jgi:hypothetical protein
LESCASSWRSTKVILWCTVNQSSRSYSSNYPVNGNIFPQICFRPPVNFLLFFFSILTRVEFFLYILSKNNNIKFHGNPLFMSRFVFHLHIQMDERCNKQIDRQTEIMKVILFFVVSLRGRLKFSMWCSLSHDRSTVVLTPTKLFLIRISTDRTFCVCLALYR